MVDSIMVLVVSMWQDIVRNANRVTGDWWLVLRCGNGSVSDIYCERVKDSI